MLFILGSYPASLPCCSVLTIFFRLGVTHNALPGRTRKEMFEEWAKHEYPEIWGRLESMGRKKMIGGDMFNIVREMEA